MSETYRLVLTPRHDGEDVLDVLGSGQPFITHNGRTSGEAIYRYLEIMEEADHVWAWTLVMNYVITAVEV